MGQLQILEIPKSRYQVVQYQQRSAFKLRELYQYQIQVTQSAFCVSPNEKQLCYQLQADKIKVKCLRTDRELKQIQIKEQELLKDNNSSSISNIGYFRNNQMMFGVNGGMRIQIFRTDKQFRQLNSIYSKNGCIYDIKVINQSQFLTCYQDGSIIITDYLKKEQTLKIPKCGNTSTSQIEFDSKNQVIISNSFDKSLKFYQMDGQNIIKYQDQTFYYQIQLINDSNYLIGRSHKTVVLWLIDYHQRRLILQREFTNTKIIYRISQYSQKRIIFLDSKWLTVLDLNDFKIIFKHKHNIKNIIYDKNSKWMENMDCLVITTFDSIRVLELAN